jgi:hypothetical protein
VHCPVLRLLLLLLLHLHPQTAAVHAHPQEHDKPTAVGSSCDSKTGRPIPAPCKEFCRMSHRGVQDTALTTSLSGCSPVVCLAYLDLCWLVLALALVRRLLHHLLHHRCC